MLGPMKELQHNKRGNIVDRSVLTIYHVLSYANVVPCVEMMRFVKLMR